MNNFNLKNCKVISHLGGSTGATLVEYNKTKYVIKLGASEEQLYNEYISNRIYHKYGAEVPECSIIKIKGTPALLFEYIPSTMFLRELSNNNIFNKLIDKYLTPYFFLDVILGNRDVIGSDYKMSNILYFGDRLYRIDAGGSLFFRAKGGFRELSEVPDELYTLRSNKNKNANLIFGKTKDQFIALDFLMRLNSEYTSLYPLFRSISTLILDPSIELDKEFKRKIIRVLTKRFLNFYGWCIIKYKSIKDFE